MPTQPGTHPLDRLQPRKSVQPSQAQEQRTHFRVTSGRTTTPTVPPHPSRSNVAGTFKLASEQESRPVHAGVSRSSNAHSRTCVALTSASTATPSISTRSRDPFAPSLGHRMKALKQRPPRYRRLSRVTRPRSSAPTRSCVAVAILRRCSRSSTRVPSQGDCAARRSPVVPFTPRWLAAHPARQPAFLRVLSALDHHPNGSRGEFAPPPTPSNRRRCIRSTASMARGQPADRCGPRRRPRG